MARVPSRAATLVANGGVLQDCIARRLVEIINLVVTYLDNFVVHSDRHVAIWYNSDNREIGASNIVA